MRQLTSPLGRIAIVAGTALLLGLAPAAFADETVALKNALYGAGYEITNTNSGMDASTRAALTKFQKDHGLQTTGNIDEATKNALGMASVNVAAVAIPAAAPAESSANAVAKAKAAAPIKEEAAEEDDEIKEKDDGGWSLW